MGLVPKGFAEHRQPDQRGSFILGAHPTSQDQSHRIDVHKFDLSRFAGKTLTQITVAAPDNAGTNFMEPILLAISLDQGGSTATVPSTCTAH